MKDDNEKKLKSHSKFNFLMGVLHGIFYNAGIAFGSSNTVLPIFLDNFTGSRILIGLSSSIMGEGGNIAGVLPQLFVASRIEHKTYKRPLLRMAITIRALCWGALALVTYLFADSSSLIAVLGLFLFLSLFTFMGGVAVIPFMDIWGKTIPSNLRGRFFGYRQLFGGILAIASGITVKFVLNSDKISFPDNYALLFLFAFILISVSYFALGSVKEPLTEVHKERLPFGKFLKKALKIIKRDKNYTRFLVVRIFSGAIALSLPFYVLYAKDVLKIRLDMIGIFLSAQMLGAVISNIIWAHVSDFLGSKKVIQISIFLGMLIQLIACFTPKRLSFLFVVLFLLIGFFMSGRTIGKNNFLLDIAPARDRPTYVSLEGTLRLPVALFPLIGGFMIQYTGWHVLFMLTLLILSVGFVLSFYLQEPRAV